MRPVVAMLEAGDPTEPLLARRTEGPPGEFVTFRRDRSREGDGLDVPPQRRPGRGPGRLGDGRCPNESRIEVGEPSNVLANRAQSSSTGCVSAACLGAATM